MPRPDAYVLECAFDSNPDDPYFSQVWTDITRYLDVKAGVRITRGRTDEFSEIQPSTFACTLRNDGRFTPGSNVAYMDDEDMNLRTTLGDWVSQSNVNLFWTNIGPTTGTGSLGLQSLAAGDVEARLTDLVDNIKPGFTYRFGFSARASAPSGPTRTARMSVRWLNALGGLVSTDTIDLATVIGSYTSSPLTRFTAPATASQAEIRVSFLGAAASGELIRFSAIFVSPSAYFPNVVTGKKLRFGVLVKGNGKQLDTDPSFNGAAPFQGSNDRAPWESKPGFPVTTIASTTTFAQSGANSMLLTLPTASSANAIVRKFVYGLIAGRQYTASVYIRVPTGSPQMNFGTTPGSVVSTTLNNTFERLSQTFIATGTNAELYIYTNAASTAGQLIQVDAVQVEEGATATTFESTSASFTWRFTGEVNEWPTQWLGGPGKLAQAAITATDQFKRLGDLGELLSTIDEDVLDDKPFAYYPLNEPAGVGGSTVSAGDISGNNENPLISKQYGSGGAITFGSEPGVPDFYVQKRTTVAINPVDENTGQYLRATLKNQRVQYTPDGATVNIFAMESVNPLTTGPLIILSGTDGSWFGVRKRSNGNISAAFYDGLTSTLYEVNSGLGMSNNRPVMFTARLEIPSAGNGRLHFYANAVETGTAVDFSLPQGVPNWYAASVGGRGSEMFRGYLSHAAFYDWAVSTGGITGWWFSAFKGTDGAGSTSYARMNKLAVYTSLDNPIRFAGLFTPTPVGPQEIEGAPIEQMRKIETTENGQWFIRGDGQSMLRLRNYRYNATASFTIASERIDPDDVSFRGDDFGLVNDVTVTRSDGATARIVNESSRQAHGRRKQQLDTLTTTDDQARALAAWIANSYGEQQNRITGVKISLLNDPSIVNSALLVDISRKISITGLPEQAPVSSIDLFIEGWTEVVAEEEWSIQYNTSPASPIGDVWQIGTAGHSEIGVTTRIGL